MRGRIIFVNPATLSGLIFGIDRQRYNFSLDQWVERGVPSRNIEVSFRTEGLEALQVKPFSPDDPTVGEIDNDLLDPLADLLPESPPSPKSSEKAANKKTVSVEADSEEIAPHPHVMAAVFGTQEPGAEEVDDFNLTETLLRQDRPILTATGPAPLPPVGTFAVLARGCRLATRHVEILPDRYHRHVTVHPSGICCDTYHALAIIRVERAVRVWGRTARSVIGT